MSKKYDAIIDLYRGEIPKSVVKGLIQAESAWKEKHVNSAPDAPGGGPKVGLMQPSRTGLKDALGVDVVQPEMLKNPTDNVRIGTTILNHYWQKLQKEFPEGFKRPLDADANAVAILSHAYTLGYDGIAQLMRDAATTSYRELANRYRSDRGIQRRWPDRVLDAARKFGYTQILPAGTLVPSGGGGTRGTTPVVPPGPAPSPPSSSSKAWLWGVALLVVGGAGVAVWASQKKRRRA